MTKLAALFTVMTCSVLALGCAVEEGYTPIGEDREDKGGGLFYLTESNPSGTIYFDCDALACDLELSIVVAASIPELTTMDGVEALLATLTSPGGSFDQSESIVIGTDEVVTKDSGLQWTFSYLAIPAGDYSVTLDLGGLDEASVIASSQLAAAE